MKYSLFRMDSRVLTLALGVTAWLAQADERAPLLSFAVMSDLHITQTSQIPLNIPKVVGEVLALKPALVVITGDFTSGNPDDHFTPDRIRQWWQQVHAALSPLMTAGIPILPIPGNHDFYEPKHQEGYRSAWTPLERFVHPLTLNRDASGNIGGDPPAYYSVTAGEVRLQLLQIVDQDISPRQASWLRGDLAPAAASPTKLRIAFGHVPLREVMAPVNERFSKKLGDLLASLKVSAYISGHDHIAWDERHQYKDGWLRLVTAGTGSGTYTFPIVPQYRALFCREADCTFPYGPYGFRIDPKDGRQIYKAVFFVITAYEDGIEAHPYYLGEDGKARLFPRKP